MKPKGQSRIDIPNKQETFGTPDTGRRQTKHKKTQHIILKRCATQTEPKTGKEPRCTRIASNSCFLQDICHVTHISILNLNMILCLVI